MAGEELYIVSGELLRNLRRIVQKLDGANGPGVVNAPESLTIFPPTPAPRVEEARRALGARLVKVTGSSSIGDNRWEYDLAVVVRESGVAVDAETPAVTFTGYNGLEDGNTSTVVYGVTLAGSGYTFTAQPVPTGAVVQAWLRADRTTGEIYAEFEAPNPLTIACDE